MIKVWSHTFDLKPCPVQSVRSFIRKDGTLGHHQDPKKKLFKDAISFLAAFGTWHEKKHIIDYPIKAELRHFYKYPTNISKKTLAHMEEKQIFTFPKTTRPDVTDNLNKGIFDALKEVLLDDSYIYALDTQKFYAPQDQIRLTFYKPYVEDFLLPWCHGKNKIENNYYGVKPIVC